MKDHFLDARRKLDLLFLLDAGASMVFGFFFVLIPHGLIANLSQNGYNHEAHEALR